MVEGLVKHGHEGVARKLVGKWLELYEVSDVWEHYNPDTGEVYGAVGLGMSTLLVDWLHPAADGELVHTGSIIMSNQRVGYECIDFHAVMSRLHPLQP